ncbi:diguanylate cyclase DgcP-like [Panonychus citri]|uniref:diguanylate cyclase DgcP-like n=1 Tax=Panonychus citri TaxID=50023 RepID=UPI0023078E0C|nr:diguanylate cyclase DgcP-like [Panonychus citri]
MAVDAKIEDFQARLHALAVTLDVSNVLVMKSDELSLKVDLSGGPEAENFPLGMEELRSPERKLYCEKVIESNGPLIVNDSTKSDEWKDNIDAAKHGLISYIGVPLHGPDGSIQGTVCAVDKKAHSFDDNSLKAITQLRDDIEKFVIEK